MLALSVNPSSALILSQIVLSFGIPFALVPLTLVTGRRDIMGEYVNRRSTAAAMWAITGIISLLNLYLIARTLLGL